MLRLPKFELARPKTVAEAVAMLEEAGEDAMLLAGGTDLVPNMKHELFTPGTVVALAGIDELSQLREHADGTLSIGAMVRLETVAADERVARRAPALAHAASLIAGPQLRSMGTMGGNVMLDTRCQWYNQSYFWREALGFCLKKDGTVCHVVEKGKRCVAAASNDSAAALMTLGAVLVIEGPAGRREVAVEDFWKSDGIFNKQIQPSELLVEVRVPPQTAGHRGTYGKLRDRGSIDFPLLGVAVRLDLGSDDAVESADMVLIGLQARPVRIKNVGQHLVGTLPGTSAFDAAVASVAAQAHKQCHPMPNIPGDHDYRREMVPVYARRTLLAAAEGSGPVHHI